MGTHANMPRFAVSRRWLTVVFAILILVANFVPCAADGRSPGAATPAGMFAVDLPSDEPGASPVEKAIGHSIGQCGCSMVVLQDAAPRVVMPQRQAASFALAPPFAMPPGTQSLPLEPPRS